MSGAVPRPAGPFVPAAVPAGWLGGAVLVVAVALFAWAIATITRAGSR